MFVEQISVFVENKTGRLADVMNLLGEAGIDIKALTVADTADFGIIRLVVSTPDKALALLKENMFTANITKVIAFSISDEPGALYKVMEMLKDNDINIKYLYAISAKSTGNADFVIRVSNNEAAQKVFDENNITVVDAMEIYA